MPAAQAASRTPGTGGISGNRSGAKGETFAALAMTSSSKQRGRWEQRRGRSLLRPGASALALQGALELWIDVLDLSLAPQVCRHLLSLLVDHGSHDPLLDRLESGSRALAPIVEPHDVPAELALEGLADFAFFQPERDFLKLGYHLTASEEAEVPALVLRSRVLGILFGQPREVAAVGEFFVDLARLVLAIDQDVAGAHLLIRFQRAHLVFVEFLGLRVGNGLPDALVEIGVAQGAAAPILRGLIEAAAYSQPLALGRVGEELVLDQEFNEHTPLRGFGERAKIAADLGLGQLHVGVRDRLAVDLGDHALLGAGRRAANGGENQRDEGKCHAKERVLYAHVRVSLLWRRAGRCAATPAGSPIVEIQ